MIKQLKKIYLNEQFNPKFIGLFINPFYFARKGLYRNVSDLGATCKFNQAAKPISSKLNFLTF